MTSPDMHTLAGAYALDALDDLERERFGRHLAECPSCAQEVRELRATAARLGAAVAEDPPPGMKGEVLAAVRATRQEPPSAGGDRGGRSRRGTGAPRWMVFVAAAAAVVGLAIGGVFGGLALHTQGELDAARQQAAQAREKYAPMGELLASPDVVTAHDPGGHGTVVMSPSLDKAVFMASNLPAPSPDREYQVWLMHDDGGVRSMGLVPGGPEPGSVLTAQGLSGVAKIGVTVEPRGGSPSPTSAPLLTISMAA
ncbi:anti-sigma factor domain-containing protein [Amycolatopsis sp. YIM 10]|uniref:anti-sigma factor n=1 Tax=Amycolatopsis sp. YIM 10 TaxID=2653857 RepID=UPI0012905CE6|nr:anti-sigma factor [Amycolatopsis sp. YIM 10]QFU87976.1 Anti-sigma-K factor RskA [Amycolatopsis sp. YIM 10]